MSASDDHLEPSIEATNGQTEASEHTTTESDPPAPAAAAASLPPYKRPWSDKLQPYLVKLARRISRDGASEVSVSLPMGGNKLRLSPYDQQLMASFTGQPGQFRPCDQMLIDSLGLQVRLYAELKKIDKSDENKTGVYKNSLVDDCDSAFNLSHQMTVMMRRLSETGDSEAPEMLKVSRTRLHKAIAVARAVLESGVPAAPEPAKSSQFVYDWNEISSQPTGIPSKPPTPSADVVRVAPTAEKKDRTAQKRAILAVLSIVLILILVNLWVHRERQLQDFQASAFPEVKGIEQVINRSPTLLIMVDHSVWTQLRRDQKHKAINAVGIAIKAAGYKKAEIRSSKEANLAVWYASGKIEVAR